MPDTQSHPEDLTQADEEIAKRDACLAAISDAWMDAFMPPEVKEAHQAFHASQKRQIDVLKAALLVTLGGWVREGEAKGFDRSLLEQTAAVEAQFCISLMMRASRERTGQTVIPARTAIAAYEITKCVSEIEPFHCDLDGAVEAFESSIEDGDDNRLTVLIDASIEDPNPDRPTSVGIGASLAASTILADILTPAMAVEDGARIIVPEWARFRMALAIEAYGQEAVATAARLASTSQVEA